MSMMTCPKYGSVECAGGVCFVCGGCGDENRCPPTSEVIEIDTVYGWRSLGDKTLRRRPTTLARMTALKPERDVRG